MTQTEPIATKKEATEGLRDLLSSFSNTLLAVSVNTQLSSFIENEFINLGAAFIEKCSQQYQLSLANSEEDFENTYLLNFAFPELFKDLALLHRDILLQLQIASVKERDQRVDPIKQQAHFEQCKLVLSESIKDFDQKISSQREQVFKLGGNRKTVVHKLKHQQNPWPIYQEQLEKLNGQIGLIESSNDQLLGLHTNFCEIKETATKVAINNKQLHEHLTSRLTTILKLFEEDKAKELLSQIEFSLDGLDKVGNSQVRFTDQLKQNIGQLNRLSVAIEPQEGFLKIVEIPLARKAQKWFDFKILPLFMDVLGQEETAKTKYQLFLSNLHGNVQLFKNKESQHDMTLLVSTIKKLIDELKNYQKRGGEISEKISSETQSSLQVSDLYKGDMFLEVSINSALSTKLDLGKNSLVQNLKIKYRRFLSYFDAKYKDSEYHESFSEIEVTTKCIAYRTLKEENEHYDTIFLSKNFIGDLFIVSRENQLKKFEEAFTQWKNGFPKAVLISGDRLSGRSSFSSIVAKKYFGKNIVQLTPGESATIDGRKFSATYHLKEALAFIKNNNSKSTAPVILIDDLELWRDKEHSLLTNVRALLRFIENETEDVLVIAVCTNALKNHLDNSINFSNTFSTLIDTNTASTKEIYESIMLRHGAGHRTLIDSNADELSQYKIKVIASKLSKKYNNNIGEVLQAWTYHTLIQGGDKILFRQEEPEFLNFFSNDELIILKQAALFKKISEYGLKSMNANSFETRFKSGIKRLLNTKILLREMDGNLSINPVVLFDVQQILKQKKYLKM